MIFDTLTDNVTVYAIERATAFAFSFVGDFGGGTLTLQGRVNGSSTWFDVTDGAWTEDATGIIDSSRNWALRLELSGASSPDLEVSLQPL